MSVVGGEEVLGLYVLSGAAKPRPDMGEGQPSHNSAARGGPQSLVQGSSPSIAPLVLRSRTEALSTRLRASCAG